MMLRSPQLAGRAIESDRYSCSVRSGLRVGNEVTPLKGSHDPGIIRRRGAAAETSQD